jgi:hypothetical protein
MEMSGNGDNPNAAALFEAANKLRGSVERAGNKHLPLGIGEESDVGQNESRRAATEGDGDIV